MDTSGRSTLVDTFSLKISKDSLDAPVKYAAEDSAVVLIKEKKYCFTGKQKPNTKTLPLRRRKWNWTSKRRWLRLSMQKTALAIVTETAHFKSGDNEFTSDTIRYNFKTQIGLTKNTYTQQGEFLVIGHVAKKVNDNVTFIKKARFTTCMLDDPHFAFVTPQMKVINKKLAVSGPAHLEFEGVPVPVYLPFGFYPLSQGRHSGIPATAVRSL